MIAIRADRLLTGPAGAAVIDDPLVILDGERIRAVTSNGLAGWNVREVVELPGTILMPGLVDAHTHLTFDAGPDVVGRLETATREELLTTARVAATRALRAGITTVRDLGDREYVTLALRDEAPDAGVPTRPRILAAGPPITTARGHCWFLGGEVGGEVGGNAAAVRAAVRERVAHGVDVVKVMATGGEITPGSSSHLSQFGLAELRAIVEEAAAAGLAVAAHAHGGAGIADAARAGVRTIEHCSFLTENGSHADPEVLALLAAGPSIASLTAGLMPGAELDERGRERLPMMMASMAHIIRSGARVVIASDAGIIDGKPHDVLPYAVADMVGLGMPAVEAIAAATSTAADACGLGGQVGRVAPGYVADLLAVDGDPIADIGALTRPVAVWARGHRVR